MPTYTFTKEDGSEVKKKLSFTEFKKVQAGELEIKDEEGRPMALEFNPGRVGFNLKDGASGSFPSKASKERKYRQKRYRVMGQRQKDHVHKPELIPNYMGQEAGSWKEAQNMAETDRDVDKDIRKGIAKGYDALVAQEKAS